MHKRTYQRRLLKLADLLEKDAKNRKGIKFNMREWAKIEDTKSLVSCGTQACAMGLAAVSGAFERAGLSFDLVPRGPLYGGPRSGTTVEFRFKGKLMDGVTAGQRLFGITYSQSLRLFTPTSSDTHDYGASGERWKARQIRRFVKTGEL